ncbi:3-keto-5-aminohexanoate cleavage protein [Brevibacillus fluminis]|uniref:3-keto-5-aminohexanoate cleavage protein n=1 Tax=Brevibacillus fluminis TaxID=511487 RepID=A0A3M8D8Z3_9BACL|nr:3-keto-5-aminohexanoate cleavage protein [Brevibacillus fluminis]RNB84502.1 3-keto-5-aminohexanoate cleavage protein [Brevibacillus fluminis]
MSGWNYTNSYEWMERVTSQEPLIVTCCCNGGVQGKEAHPGIPESPEEIADSVYEAYKEGASVVHVHGRNPKRLGETTMDPEVLHQINGYIRERCPDIIINNTTGGGPTSTMDDRIRCLEAMPEMASLNMGPDMSRFVIKERDQSYGHSHPAQEYDICVPFTYGFIEQLAEKMLEKGIIPEMEMYHSGQFWVAQDLITKGLIKKPYLFQFVMGYQTSTYPTPENLIHLARELPDGAHFAVAGIGKYQWAMTTFAILLGGHVRVGLEDNIYLKRGQKLKSNGEAVAKIVRIATELNRDIATPAQARAMLGVSAIPSSY